MVTPYLNFRYSACEQPLVNLCFISPSFLESPKPTWIKQSLKANKILHPPEFIPYNLSPVLISPDYSFIWLLHAPWPGTILLSLFFPEHATFHVLSASFLSSFCLSWDEFWCTTHPGFKLELLLPPSLVWDCSCLWLCLQSPVFSPSPRNRTMT